MSAPKLDPTNPAHLEAARAVLAAAGDAEAARLIAGSRPIDASVPLQVIQLLPLGSLRGYQVTVANQHQVMDAVGGQPFRPGHQAGPAECFYVQTSVGEAEINIGDVLVHTDAGWAQVLAEELGLLWILQPVAGTLDVSPSDRQTGDPR